MPDFVLELDYKPCPCIWNAKQQSWRIRHEAAPSPSAWQQGGSRNQKEPSNPREHLPPTLAPQPLPRKEELWQITVSKFRSGGSFSSFLIQTSFISWFSVQPGGCFLVGISAVPDEDEMLQSTSRTKSWWRTWPQASHGCQIHFPYTHTQKKSHIWFFWNSAGGAQATLGPSALRSLAEFLQGWSLSAGEVQLGDRAARTQDMLSSRATHREALGAPEWGRGGEHP